MEGILGGILAQLAPVLITAIGTLASFGMVYLNRWLKAKAGGESIAAVNEVVGSVVSEIGATMAKEVKTAAADGKITAAEAQMLKNTAIERVKSQLPGTVAKAASRAVGDLTGFIAGKIEKEVAGSKLKTQT